LLNADIAMIIQAVPLTAEDESLATIRSIKNLSTGNSDGMEVEALRGLQKGVREGKKL